MPKKPSSVQETAAIAREAERAIAMEDSSFRPTKDQYLARARLHLELRDNPGRSVNQLTYEQIAHWCRDKRVVGWLRKFPEFRAWLTAPRDTEERIEAAYSRFVEDLEFRRAGMSDKDFINTLKLLAELGNRFPQKWQNTKVLDADVSKMSDVEKEQLLVDTVRKMGYSVVTGGDPGALDPNRAADQSENSPPVHPDDNGDE